MDKTCGAHGKDENCGSSNYINVKAEDRLEDNTTRGNEYVVCSSNHDGGLSGFEIRVFVLGLVMYKAHWWLYVPPCLSFRNFGF